MNSGQATRFSGDTVFIYAFEDAAGSEVLYVGQTIDPATREHQHRMRARVGRFSLPSDARFRLLRKCSYGDACEVEHQIITELQRKGQCRLNGNHGLPHTSKQRFVTYEVAWVEADILFTGPAQAARYFGVSKGTVLNALKGRTILQAPDGKTATVVRHAEAGEPGEVHAAQSCEKRRKSQK